MINSRKKGFTLVELVIVIAVVAILAAVLIPTFSNLVKKANESADIQATRQMNTVLTTAGELSSIDDAIDALAEAGYNSKEALIPVSTGHTFYWYAKTKQIILVNEKNEVVFPEGIEYDGTGESLEGNAKYINVEATSKESLNEAASTGNIEVVLGEDIKVDKRLIFSDELNLDLNGKTLSSSNSSEVSGKAADGYTLSLVQDSTISGEGTITNDAGGAVTVLDAYKNGITVTINGGTYIGVREAIYVWGGHLVINGGHFECTGDDKDYVINMLDEAEDKRTWDASVTIKGGTFVNFNPANNKAEGEGTNFVAEGYTVESKEVNGDTWYTVVKK